MLLRGDMSIVSELKQYYISRGITQKELAKRLGVTFMTVSRWLNGKNLPGDRKEYRIKVLLGKIVPRGENSNRTIEQIKTIRDSETGKEEIMITYITEEKGSRVLKTIAMTGKELADLIVAKRNKGKMKINTFVNNKGEKYTWGIGTPEDVEALNTEKDFKTTLEVLDTIRRNLNIEGKIDRKVYGIRKARV